MSSMISLDEREPSEERDLPITLDEGVVDGMTLGPAYEVIRELGRGGMAVVYLARERATGQERAVKVIHRKYIGDVEAITRFEREARLVASLTHPRIVPVHRTQWIEGVGLALVMDRVPGYTVKQLIQRQGPLPLQQVYQVLDDIADALGYAHAQGIIHRDVKPENIFVNADTGHAMLSDFGIARSMQGDTTLTLAGVALGTPTYMSPEQIDGDAIDGRSDLYSLGMVGWEMLTGQRPWNGETLYKIIYRQKHDQLARIDLIRPDVPERLLIAVEGLLEKTPKDRWQSASDVREHLTGTGPMARQPRRALSEAADDALLDGETVAIVRPSKPKPLLSRAMPKKRRARWVAMPIGAVGLAGSAMFIFGGGNGRLWQAVVGMTPPLSQVASRIHSPAIPRIIAPVMGVSSASMLPPIAPPYAAPVTVPVTPHDTAPTRMDSTLKLPKVLRPLVYTATSMRGPASPTVIVPSAPSVSSTPIAAPVLPPDPPARGEMSIATGAAHSCLVNVHGAAFCWGANDRGQLGASGNASDGAPVSITSTLHFTHITAGVAHTCALIENGTTYCWGSNEHGQVGDGSRVTRMTPTRVTDLPSVRIVASGATHTCALTREGTAYCWGDGQHGQLGNGQTRVQTAPVSVKIPGNALVSVVTGWNHSCALRNDGVAFCWGSNDAGELGDGTTTTRSTPVMVRANVRFVALSAGNAHTCGVTEPGVAYCWGRNSYGELGDGTTTTRSLPTMVASDVPFRAIAAGGVHTCALGDDSMVWCWGRNTYGQLGDGSATNRLRPVPVSGRHAFETISAFGAHTCGRTTTNELFCWGYNLQGQLGDGTREHRYRPVYVEQPQL